MKQKSTYLFFFLPAALLLAAALLAGCKTDTPELSAPDGFPMEIQFQVSNATPSEATRATIVNDNSDLQSQDITVYGYFHGSSPYRDCFSSDMRYSSSTWKFIDGGGNQVHFYWPIEGSVHTTSSTTVTSLDFFGLCPATPPSHISFTLNPTGPIISCTSLPVTSAGQTTLKEFLYAFTPGQTYTDQVAAGGAIPLEFHHPFAKISLQLKTSHRAIYNLNTIKFKNIKNNGTFTHANNPQWVASGGNTDLTITVNDGISADADFTSAQVTSMSLPLIVLPQSLTTADQIEVKLTWNNGDSETTYTFDNPVGEWQSGKSYTYTLDLLGEIKFSVIIDNWSSEETTRNIRF